MIDIHNHILPGVDDGAKSWDTALEMCRLAQEDGIQHIVATPHANDEYVYEREHLLACLKELAARAGDSLTFSLGCDFRLSYDNVEDALAYPRRYTIGEGPYLLVEFSDYGIPPRIGDSLFNLRAKNMIPVITHPERNPILQRHLPQVAKWVQEGCLVQVTASALAGTWGESARRAADWLLEHEAVHVLASDAHDPKHRKPVLSFARDLVAKRFGCEIAHALVEHNPRAIVAGEMVPFSPAPVMND
jgi:protein-tyrosine phosphatase